MEYGYLICTPFFVRRNKMKLTASQIRYLLAIYKLSNNGVVRSADIADNLFVTRPSVHRMIIQMSKMNLITKEKYSYISITENGRILAEQYYNEFCHICKLLNNSLGLPFDSVENGVITILSRLDLENLNSVCMQKKL